MSVLATSSFFSSVLSAGLSLAAAVDPAGADAAGVAVAAGVSFLGLSAGLGTALG